MPEKMNKELKEDTELAHYRLVSKIGAGGMGEVYLAEDTRLGRRVAIKFLNEEFSKDSDKLKRFIQEAKAASALNHPNILTVYEIGEVEGKHYISAELIDGKTLREHLSQKEALPLNTILKIGVQVAEALSAAHQAGIIHRDIKPENIMLRDDGIVKVLDFGLAKLVRTQTGAADPEDATRVQVNTRPGVVMGTVLYMSPEQARGKESDARSDIWSLGLVMYEMLTKRTPFAGETANDSIAAILTKEPPPLDEATPSELRRIVRKCLQKQTDERYQTVKDLLLDVKNLKKELEFSEELERSQIPQSTGSSNVGTAQMSGNATAMHSGVISTQNSVPQQRSSAEYLVSQVKDHKKGVLLGLGLLVLVIAGVAFGVYKFAGRKDTGSAPSFESMKITKLTDTAKAGSAAISPDGKYVVHVKEDAGQQSLWVVHIATGSNVQIIAPAEVEYGRMTFSPDGNYIYFGKREKGEANRTLYQVPVLGGDPKKLNSNVGSPVTFSPDGKRFAFVRNQPGASTMMIANADGTGEQPLAAIKSPESFKTSGPAWSPDGKVIATATASNDGGYHNNLIEVRVEDGAVKPIGTQKWTDAGRVAWLADGSGLIAACGEQGTNVDQVYQISYPGGEARKITNDLNDYHDTSLTADSGSMVTVQENRVLNIWIAPDGNASHARQLTHGANKYDGEWGLQWAPDGTIVYSSLASGSPSVWIMNGDGGNPRRLTQNEGRYPSVSPDGRYVVFSSPQAGAAGIWRMDIDGGNPKQLTNNLGQPSISPDGRWVISSATVSGERRLWKVSIDGGEPVRLTDNNSIRPAVSADGKSIACLYREQENSPWRIAIIPFEGGQPTKLLDVPAGYNTAQISLDGIIIPQPVHWLPDGCSLAYSVTRDGFSNIWSMPIDGGAPKQLTNFTSDQIAYFDLSRDGKPTLFSRGATTKDVILISGFRK
jgi:serine/threonine protein kinase/Tol biopolymer transport system component